MAAPEASQYWSRLSYGAGAPDEFGRASPIASDTQAIVLAVNCPPQAPADGQATPLQDRKGFIGHGAGLVPADRLEDILDGHILAIEPPRQDRATIDEHRRDIQPDHRHHHARQGFVTAGQSDQRVIAMTAHGQLDGVGNCIP